ncbi:integrase core domain-containing protein [Leptospira sp. GIMC2001]|uniref:integrase core domain-containing protein n=1 Tax=Leptospira sp. GIMC2001 TaxID=1513297 RepID=UPI00234A0116|nr:integrase core domain-containing protein [Leptospira sp. GIMC2001]WCL48106.1 integrase core domain-containing protein [Leptospira sp. GIMC2001]
MDSIFSCFIFFLIFVTILSQIYSKNQLILENLLLKSQLASFKRRFKKFHTTPIVRLQILALSLFLTNWKESLILVTPETLLSWRKDWFKKFWTSICTRKKSGRPMTPWDTIKTIRRLAKENCIWGATKLHGLMLKLGFDICERTISKYIPNRPIHPKKRLSWKNFYNLHADCIVVKDFFSVYSVNFQEIYRVLFCMHLGTRRILHYEIHTHPTTYWVRRILKLSIRKAVKSDLSIKYVISDNDSLFGKRITRFLGKTKIKHKRTSIRSPWQNGYAERFVKTCKEEFLDYFIPMNQFHLETKLDEFIIFYNNHRTHIAINKETPIPSVIDKPPDSKLVATPVLNGLYHIYSYEKAA